MGTESEGLGGVNELRAGTNVLSTVLLGGALTALNVGSAARLPTAAVRQLPVSLCKGNSASERSQILRDGVTCSRRHCAAKEAETAGRRAQRHRILVMDEEKGCGAHDAGLRRAPNDKASPVTPRCRWFDKADLWQILITARSESEFSFEPVTRLC